MCLAGFFGLILAAVATQPTEGFSYVRRLEDSLEVMEAPIAGGVPRSMGHIRLEPEEEPLCVAVDRRARIAYVATLPSSGVAQIDRVDLVSDRRTHLEIDPFHIVVGIDLSPNGKSLAFCAQDDRGVQLYLYNLDETQDGKKQELLTQHGLGSNPRFSEDGRNLVFEEYSKAGGLFQMPVDGKAPTRMNIGVGGPRFPVWNADRSRLAYVRTGGANVTCEIVVADGSGEKGRAILESVPGSIIGRPAFSPDGAALFIPFAGRGIWKFDLQTNTEQPLLLDDLVWEETTISSREKAPVGATAEPR